MRVGTVVKLKLQLLGCKKDEIGVCYERYTIDNNTGHGIIFKNGNYDGFSEKEEIYLEEIGFCKELSDYNFTSVMKLSLDYEQGYFDVLFKREKYEKIKLG